MRLIYCSLIFLLFLLFPLGTESLEMSSTNYKIVTEAVSVGGATSTSASYQLFNTAGETAGVHQATSTSSNYIVQTGFPFLSNEYTLSATLSTNAINLGTLSTSAVSTISQTLTVTANIATGYVTYISDDGNLRSGSNDINDVSGGTVTAGTEGYGLRTSGTAGQMNAADTAVTTGLQTIARSTVPVANEVTTITYKAAIGSGTSAGTYSHTATLSTVINY